MQETEEIIKRFWETPEFWISFILASIGILIGWYSLHYSKKSFSEAKLAKEAAQKAGKTVRKQDIIVVLTEVLNECNVFQTSNYYEMSGKYRLIHRRISNIRGLYSNDLNDEQSGHLEKIESSLDLLRSQLDLFNTSISSESSNGEGDDLLFMTLEPPMTQVAGHIELLKGALQDSLI